ncbi:MAG: hypothetical protein JXA13_15775 [Anaerolineales bacterium]|nr:hypothetical protein [Anaerolineales bacterium]
MQRMGTGDERWTKSAAENCRLLDGICVEGPLGNRDVREASPVRGNYRGCYRRGTVFLAPLEISSAQGRAKTLFDFEDVGRSINRQGSGAGGITPWRSKGFGRKMRPCVVKMTLLSP